MAPLLLLLLALGAGPGERGPAGGSGAVAAAGARGPSGGGTGPGVVARDLVAGGGGRVQGRAGPCGKHRDPATPTGATATPRHQHGPTATEPTATEPTATGQLSTAESFALATLAALVLALSPLVAVALLRCPLCPRVRGWLCPAGLGLAAGALSGDGILHLLPQAMGLHSHDEGLRSRGGGPPVPRGGAAAGPPWPLLGVLGGLFGAFLLEKLLGILLPRGGEGKVDDLDRSTQELQSSGPAPLPWVVTAGRAAHGLADGLALGGAFSASWRSGAVTAAALLCHELPHALGAMGVLSRAGLSVRRMVALGLGGALPLLPGVYAGLALGGAPTARPWVGAAATGLLLHLALCDMVPDMLAERAQHPWALLGLQSAGLLGGWGLLLLLAVYEGRVLG